MQRYRFLCFIIMYLLGIAGLQAALPYGAIITYRYLDYQKYEVRLMVYRDCSGTSFILNDSMYVKCYTGNRVAMNVKLLQIREITPLCATEKPRCYPVNTDKTGAGYEEHIYIDTVDFNNSKYASVSTCEEVRFEWSSCCRSNLITSGAANAQLYNYAILNRRYGEGNSSPQLLFPPVLEVPINSAFYYHPGFSDSIDHDSVSYSFEYPQEYWNGNLGYTGKYSKQVQILAYWPGSLKYPYANPSAIPPIGVYLDPQSGELILTPTVSAEISTLLIQAKEWKKDSSGKMQAIGVVRYDVNVKTTIVKDNYSPTVSIPRIFRICTNNQFCFKIATQDKSVKHNPPNPPVPPDTVSLIWDHGIKGATFKILDSNALNPTAEFCWTPPDSASRNLPYQFLVEAKDNNCPQMAVSRASFRLIVYKRPVFNSHIFNKGCNNYSVKIKLDSQVYGNVNYAMEIYDSAMNLVEDTTIFSFSNNKIKSSFSADSLSFYKSGVYVVKTSTTHSLTGCSIDNYDTIHILQGSSSLISQSDTFYCEHDSIFVLADDYLHNKGLKNLKWYQPHQMDTSITTKIEILNDVANVRLTAEDIFGCIHTDFLRIERFGNPVVNLGRDTLLCYPLQYTLHPLISKIPKGHDLRYFWSNGKTDDTLDIKQGDRYFVDIYGICGYGTDTIIILDKNNVLEENSPVTICEGIPSIISAQEVGSKYNWETNDADSFRFLTVTAAGLYPCNIVLACGDTVQEIVKIQSHQIPDLILPSDTFYCEGDSAALIAGRWDIHTIYHWENNDRDSIRYVKTPGVYSFIATNICGTFYDSVNVSEKRSPIFDIGSDTIYCQPFKHRIQLLDSILTYFWSDSTFGHSKEIFQPGTYIVKAVGFCGTAFDTITIQRENTPIVYLGNDTALYAPFQLILDAGNSGAKYLWSTQDTGQKILVESFGQYYVRVQNSCGISYDTININNVLQSKKLVKGQMVIYPNPSEGAFRINNPTGQITRLKLVDSNGRLIKSRDIEPTEIIECDWKDVSSGSYNLYVEFRDGSKTCVLLTFIH